MKTQAGELKKKYSKEIFQLINGPWKLKTPNKEKFFAQVQKKHKERIGKKEDPT